MKKIIIAFLVFLTFNAKAQFSGGGTTSSTVLEYGEQILTALGTSASFTTIPNGTFTIPSAGTWNVGYNVYFTPTEINESVQYRLINVTSGNTVVPGSLASIANAGVSGHIDQTTTQNVVITTTGATIFAIQGLSVGSVEIIWSSGVAVANSKVYWQKISGFIPISGQTVDAVSVSLTGSNFSVPVVNTDVIFNTLDFGIIPYNTTTGVFTLTGGKTYELESTLKSRATVAGYIQYEWVDAITSTAILGGINGLDIHATSTLSEGSSSRAYLMYTPATNQTVKVRITGVSGTAIQLDASRCNANIKQLGSSAVSTTPVNDQAASGYIDIGNVRMQWGRTTNGFNGARTITLPAAFANTNYTVTATSFSTGSSTQLSRTVFLGDYTTSTFIGRCVTGNDSSSGVDWNWTAFGQKP